MGGRNLEGGGKVLSHALTAAAPTKITPSSYVKELTRQAVLVFLKAFYLQAFQGSPVFKFIRNKGTVIVQINKS